jgi:hypothetical protein
MKLQLKPATAQTCTYVERSRPCTEDAAGELRAHYVGEHEGKIPWPLCKLHLSPEFHPPDLRKKLFRWAVVR